MYADGGGRPGAPSDDRKDPAAVTEKIPARVPGGAVAEGELTALLGTMPYAVSLGVELEAASAAETRGHLHWAPERCTIGGALHGGALMSLADAVGAVCAYLNLPAGAAGTTTVESKTNFFRALRSGTVRAVARPLHTGRSFVTVQTDLVDDEGRLAGQTTQTQAVLMPRD
ncbi:Esterase YdiI [Streptomyces sp. ADI98-12]|uniref:Aromatic compounds degradation protein paaI n=1 Tax=Streptomyces griseus TaxID=1911 RepID=A0A380P4U0_STRGR|nr:Esterase YdiI [Streptomyces sp. ADI98-12]GFH68235.1 hypothetical protein Srut_47490 [Streptomyces rutgersensis]GGU28612.1 hypothetical protein GCM10015534_34010 [Streptomyces diastaticus subsp. diastaticus]SUP59834.1 Aromatic compounds degradation protein paaI [Streptomyces griseus]